MASYFYLRRYKVVNIFVVTVYFMAINFVFHVFFSLLLKSSTSFTPCIVQNTSIHFA
jgi:hypothetical protein